MRKLVICAVLLLGGCAHSIESTCTRHFGFEPGSEEYQSCIDAETAKRKAAIEAIQQRERAFNKALLGAAVVGIAAYGESKNPQPSAPFRSPTISGGTYYLQNQWIDGGQRFCAYSNGTTINIGVRLCPESITG